MQEPEDFKSQFQQIKELEDYYKLQFKTTVGKGKLPGTTFADRHRLGELLKTRPEEEVKMLINHFLKMNDSWFKKLGYSLDSFFQGFNKILFDIDKSKKLQAPRANPQQIKTLGWCRNVKCGNRFFLIAKQDFSNLDTELCGECHENPSPVPRT